MAQEPFELQEMQQMERLQPPGALPQIHGVSPVGPDGQPYLRPGETFVITGSAFSSVPGQTRIGIRTWAEGDVRIPPQQGDFVADLLPTNVSSDRLEAVAPGGIATGTYLLWVHVEGSGHSAPAAFRFSNPEQPSGKDPRITQVSPQVRGLETAIRGAGFSQGALVHWPIGLAQVATYVNSTTLRIRVPKGLSAGQHQVRVEVNGRWSAPANAKILEPMPLNMYWDRTDRNGIPLNPRWGWQLTHAYGEPGYYPKPADMVEFEGSMSMQMDWSKSTDQELSYDTGWFGCGPHVNWHRIPVTFTGYWLWSHKSPWAEDDDCNFYFFPPEGAGATDRGTRNPGGIMTEFDMGATLDHFHTSWWSEFRRVVDDESDKAHAMTSGKYGIVTGRWGLDCAHECYSEIHPVWAMAVLAKNDPYDDRWSMFLRPWGDQGFCGDKNHGIRFNTENGKEVYTFELPWRPGASSVKWSQEFLCKEPCSLSIKPVVGQSVLVSLKYPWGTDKQRINGQVRLSWSYPAGTSAGYYSFPQSAQTNVARAMQRPAAFGSEYQRAMEKLSAKQQEEINRNMPVVMKKPPATRDAVALQIEPPGAELSMTATSLPQITLGTDPLKMQRMSQLDSMVREMGISVRGEALQPSAVPESVGVQPTPARPSRRGEPLEPEIADSDRRPGNRAALTLEPETNRPGHDYRSFDLPEPDPERCRQACAEDDACRAYTFVHPGVQGERARCWLKNHAEPAVADPCCVSGARGGG